MDKVTIRETRKALKLTQAQAGAILGTGRRTWQDWERGLYAMPPAKWATWCILAGVSTFTRP